MPSSSRHFLAAALKEIDKHKADARDLQSTIVLLNSKMPPPHISKLPVSSYILLLTIGSHSCPYRMTSNVDLC